MWTIWSPNDLPAILGGKVRKLHAHPQCVHACCRCSKPKRALTVVKADASQFFKDASQRRGTSCALDLISRLTSSLGATGVAVKRGKKASGKL
eukprot:3884446-Pyramimonas_sp.AAC.1